LKEIGVYMRHVEKRMHDYLETLSPESLKKKYEGERGGKLETLLLKTFWFMFSKRKFIIEAN
jgi:hypothetical protein